MAAIDRRTGGGSRDGTPGVKSPSRAAEAREEADRAFERLYRGHRDDVSRAALRDLKNVHDAEDVTQAAFVDAYRAVLRGSSPEAPRAWLLAIAENGRRRFRRVLRGRARPAAAPMTPLPTPRTPTVVATAPIAPPAVELPALEVPPLALRLRLPQLPEVAVPPLPPPQVEPVVAPIVETVSGAAGDAGIVAPPLPSNPLDTLPPALPSLRVATG